MITREQLEFAIKHHVVIDLFGDMYGSNVRSHYVDGGEEYGIVTLSGQRTVEEAIEDNLQFLMKSKAERG